MSTPTQLSIATSSEQRVEDILLVTPLESRVGDADREINVLHVDDESSFTDLTGTYLERLSDDLAVDTAESADAGLDLLSDTPVDCIVSDYDMPGRNGLEFLEAVREEHPELPFILFTGKGSEEIASEAIAAGVTEYMQKASGPDQYQVLANRIRHAVERYRTEQELWTTLSWYQRLVEQDLAGIYLVQDREFIYVNEKMADIFEYSQHELVGESPWRIVDEADRDTVTENLSIGEYADHKTFKHTFTGTDAAGNRFDVECHGGSITFQGAPAVMGLLIDLGERASGGSG